MEFYVVYDETANTVFDFKQQDFIDESNLNQNCILPSITFALKVTKHPYLFLRMNHIGTLKPKKVKVEGFTADVYSESEIIEKKLEVSW
jgi:hypothetical protein